MNRFIKFLAYISIPVAIGFMIVGYYKLSEFKSNVWESKAIIAQMEPAIIKAEGEYKISEAVAFSVYTNSVITTFAVGVPYLLILLYTFYKLVKFGVENYEKLRYGNSVNINNN